MPVRVLSTVAAFIFALAFLAPLSPAWAEENDVIGTIQEAEGSVTVTAPSGVAVAAVVDTPVHAQDLIETGPDSKAFVLLIDNTELTLSENASLRLDDYVYDSEDNTDNKAAYSVLKGTFLYVSGLVAKKENPDVTVNTPYGAIGIRGTEFWGGDLDGKYGVLVNEGAVNVRNWGGAVALAKGQGTWMRSKAQPPAAAKVWTRDQIDRAVLKVRLKNQEAVRHRIQQQQQHYKTLREKLRQSLQVKRDQLRGSAKQNRQNQPAGANRPGTGKTEINRPGARGNGGDARQKLRQRLEEKRGRTK